LTLGLGLGGTLRIGGGLHLLRLRRLALRCFLSRLLLGLRGLLRLGSLCFSLLARQLVGLGRGSGTGLFASILAADHDGLDDFRLRRRLAALRADREKAQQDDVQQYRQ